MRNGDGCQRWVVATCIGAAGLLLAVAAVAKVTKEQKATAQTSFDLYPSTIEVPVEFAEIAWNRASEWISAIPDRAVRSETKNEITTYRSRDSGSMDLSCSANRRRNAEISAITARCGVNNPFAAGEQRRANVMLRRYIMTGDDGCFAQGSRWTEMVACSVECTGKGVSCRLQPAELVFDEDLSLFVEEEPAIVGTCTLEQIVTMAQSGLAKEQIMAACDDL